MSTTPMTDTSTETSQEETPRSDFKANAGSLLVCLPSISTDGLQTMQQRLSAAFPSRVVQVATPGVQASDDGAPISLLPYPEDASGYAGFALTATDFHIAADLAVQHDADVTLVLGAEATSLSTDALQSLVDAVVSGTDLALPRYRTGPHEALVSSAFLYPITRALFSVEAHLPLPLDAAFSARMAMRLRVVARKPTADAHDHPLIWPVAEAAIASFLVRELDGGERTLPQPSEGDLSLLLAEVAGSLFADIEAKATFWQRARPAAVAKTSAQRPPATPELDGPVEVHSMAEDFHNAFNNLQEIWSLVLPPQSLLALKKLSRVAPDTFEMSPNLWARVVYDFVLAWHLRTLNRGHLLGSFTPLYLAWVASHLRLMAGDASLSSHHAEETATAFLTEKPYLVSRWRWPDRFNP